MKVTRWRRYGKDRLYVKDADGHDVGWWDLVENAGHPATPGADALLVEALTAWQSAVADPPVLAETGAPVPTGSPGPDVLHWGPEYVPPETRPTASPVLAPVVPQTPVVEVFAPPLGPPFVADLLYNRPGEQLAGKVAAAREAGERPTLWRRFWLGKNAYSTWERGAIGERLVAEELDKLVRKDRRWGYLNSILVSDEVDIDLFVVGPGGVFTVNAKHHRRARIWVGGDTVMVNGIRQPYVRNSRHEARKASRLLSRAIGHPVGVQGVVVPVAASAFTVKTQPADVHVINRARLNVYLRSRPAVLEPAQVEQIFNAARLSSTWLPIT